MMEEWNDGRTEEWKTEDILFSEYCLFPIFQHSNIPFFQLPNFPVFQYSIIPMFNILRCGYAAMGPLWLDIDVTTRCERRGKCEDLKLLYRF
jgi:hypothetical protein